MSKVDFNLAADARSDMGKGASRRLRREGMVPAVLYGGSEAPVSLSIDHDNLVHHLENEAFYSHILTITLDGKAHKAVLKDLQRHPARPIILHADFQRVSASEKLRMHVPIHFVGAESCPGVKAGGVVTHNMTDVEITCLPKDLPEFIEADMSALNVGDTVHLTDLKVPKGVELVELSHGADHDQAVAIIQATRGMASDEAGEEGEAEAAEGGE